MRQNRGTFDLRFVFFQEELPFKPGPNTGTPEEKKRHQAPGPDPNRALPALSLPEASFEPKAASPLPRLAAVNVLLEGAVSLTVCFKGILEKDGIHVEILGVHFLLTHANLFCETGQGQHLPNHLGFLLLHLGIPNDQSGMLQLG